MHPGAPDALAAAVSQVLQLRPGQQLLDLYAGAGMFAAALADAATGRIEVVEGDRRAAAAARANLRHLAGCRITRSDVAAWLAAYRGRPDAVVLDPPRDGAGADVIARAGSDQARQGRLRGLRSGVAGPGSAHRGRPRLVRRVAGRLRPVPHDPSRRVRRRAAAEAVTGP